MHIGRRFPRYGRRIGLPHLLNRFLEPQRPFKTATALLPNKLEITVAFMRIRRLTTSLVFVHIVIALCGSVDAQTRRVGLGLKYLNDVGIASDPAVVFFDDFESGNFNKWNDYDGNPGPLHAVVSEAGPAENDGNHAARLRAPAGQRGGADLVKALPRGYDKLFARWYVKYEPGFNFDAPNHGSGLYGGSRDYIGASGNRPTGSDWFGASIEYTTNTHQASAYVYYRGMYQDCANSSGQCWGDHFPAASSGPYAGKPNHLVKHPPPVLQAGRWYAIELMFDAGTPSSTDATANGVFNYWIDGMEIGPFDKLWLRTSNSLKVQNLWISLFHHDGTHSVPGIMVDNVVIATKRIGPLVRASEVPEPETGGLAIGLTLFVLRRCKKRQGLTTLRPFQWDTRTRALSN